jgi:hypothetical protein
MLSQHNKLFSDKSSLLQHNKLFLDKSSLLPNTINYKLEHFLIKQLLPISSPLAIKYILSICYFISTNYIKNELINNILIYKESSDFLIKFNKTHNYINNEYHLNTHCSLLEQTGLCKISEDNIIYNNVNFVGKLKKIFKYDKLSFKKLNNHIIDIEFMKCNDVFPYYENDLFQIIELELIDNNHSLYILFPKSKRFYYDIKGMIDILNIKFIKQELILRFPKLSINKSINLKNMFKDFRIINLFNSINDIHHQVNFDIHNGEISNEFKCLTMPIELNINSTFDYYLINKKNKMITLFGTFDA